MSAPFVMPTLLSIDIDNPLPGPDVRSNNRPGGNQEVPIFLEIWPLNCLSVWNCNRLWRVLLEDPAPEEGLPSPDSPRARV